jgi:hypothetical protein
MTRSPAKSPLLALVVWLVALLQLVSALHFVLVPHTFSAAHGGIVHVHSASRPTAEPRASVQAPRVVALIADAATCSADLCPTADVPPSSLLHSAANATGWAAYGGARLLCERAARSAESQRVFLSAPKTSPPV